MHITSRDNSLLRQAQAVRDGKAEELIFVEGLRLCEEALLSALPIESVIFSEEIARKPKAARIIKALTKVSSRIGSVSEKLLESVSYTKTPQGIIVLAHRPEANETQLTQRLEDNSLLVIMHHLNNPVNVGAILRTAEAAGAMGAIVTKQTSDPFSPKALRGAMGSAFRLPIWIGPTYEEVIDWCRRSSILSVCAAAAGSILYTDIDWNGRRGLILGPESTGLTTDEISAAGQAVSIPMQGSVESLNVSVAAGIFLYEAARQRHARQGLDVR